MNVQTSRINRPTFDQALLLILVLFASTIDALSSVKIVGLSGLGALTLISAGAIWIIWVSRPILPPSVLITVLPLIFFEIDAAGTLFWYRPDQGGVQLLVVSLSFLALTMLTARITAQTPAFAQVLLRALVLSSIITVGLYVLKLYSVGSSLEGFVGDRSFALQELVIIAALLALWRGYSWPPRNTFNAYEMHANAFSDQPRPVPWLIRQLPAAWAMVVVAMILLSLSRTALVISLALFPLAVAFRGNTKSLLSSLLMLAVGAGLFTVALYSYQPLYDRFFHEDAAMKVGGVAINGSGRTKIWELLLNTLHDDWIFGKGVSSSEAVVAAKFKNIAQPHNDYLRFYYDQGIVGVSLWLFFIATMIHRLVGNLRRSIQDCSTDYALHLAALLTLIGVSLSMLTDNSVCYPFVMFPFAMLLGCSLGTDAQRRHPLPVTDTDLSAYPLYTQS